MPIAWHPLGWWDLCMHEYEKINKLIKSLWNESC